jgi:peptide/nickel transport system substrate-binding protein
MTTGDNSQGRLDRRDYLRYIGATGVGGMLAGCMGGGESSGDSEQQDKEGNAETQADKGDGEAQDASTFVVGMSSKASTLDLHGATRRPEATILSAINEPLFRIDEGTEPVAHLASDYSRNDDATEFTFQLEEGVTFHDGSAFDAEVAKWNYERFLENSPNAYLLGPVDTIEATGEYELTISFEDSYPLLPRYLTNWTTGFVSKQAVEEHGDEYGQATAVGTGPYAFDSWERGTAVEVTKFEEYDWGPDSAENQGPGKADAFRFELLPEATTLLQELTNGKVHGSSYVTLSDVSQVEDSGNTELLRKEYTRPGYLALNVQKEPTDDVRVRRAINHAVRKEPVIEAALGGEGYPIWSIVPPIARNALGEDQAKSLGEQYNLEKARQLLDDAGWTNDSQGAVRSKDGQDLELTFYAFTIPRYQQMGKVVAPMLGEVGINATLQVLEAGTLYNNLESGEHHMTTMAYGGNWAANALEPILKGENTATEGGTNYSLWQNDEFDELLNKGKTHPDAAEREQAMVNAQKLVLEEAPVTPICAFNKVYGYESDVQGVDDWTEHEWWPDQEWLNRLEFDA